MSTTKGQTQKKPTFVFRKRRVFSEVFKREQVNRTVAGHITIAQLYQNWNIAKKTAYQ
jgi:hypothetical protein